ncbi:MAG: hypothetical protein M3Q65_12005 [Chloroflexota bacterium]|nr:hypothetical protein [Chloroflexota bacterium]
MVGRKRRHRVRWLTPEEATIERGGAVLAHLLLLPGRQPTLVLAADLPPDNAARAPVFLAAIDAVIARGGLPAEQLRELRRRLEEQARREEQPPDEGS